MSPDRPDDDRVARSDHVHYADLAAVVDSAGSVTAAFADLTKRIDREGRKRFLATVINGILVGLVAVMMVILLLTVRQQERDRVDAARATCVRGNESRSAIVDGIHAVVDGLVQATNRPRSPDEQDAYEAVVARFRADVDKRLEPLGPREC